MENEYVQHVNAFQEFMRAQPNVHFAIVFSPRSVLQTEFRRLIFPF